MDYGCWDFLTRNLLPVGGLSCGDISDSGPKPSDSPSMLSTAGHQSPVSLLLLILTVVMSSCIYVWVLRFVCIGCCQPVAVGCESDALADMV
ncbi:hypothetical protein KUCAC02_000363 [Chaenocephalus aceratus]|uniref:Uncharacterized protein n=1 Tax=Chaenocephalus aceratus TaxID=36190 RepID=A0ACB9W5F6_CHAAC|nr:hypothetical protein KUCAC02_000363 [Chaenocephalus aceratus]